MLKPLSFARLMLITTALSTPAMTLAQTTPEAALPEAAAEAADASTPEAAPAPQEAAPDVSVPGGDPGEIVVRGRATPNLLRTTPQVVTTLSTADIARTGDGNIAGALGRITGLSVVGNGFVYVRGLGDRYSLALLNGSPLPSPEPLKRVVPLDLFPTNIVSSSLVQKSYSPNFPGEFGGGVINLTTTAVPNEAFLNVSSSIGGNYETTNKLGYTYYGSSSDWTGFDNGSRGTPPALAAFIASGERLSDVNTTPIAAQLVSPRMVVVQTDRHIQPDFSASLAGGASFDVSDTVRLGLIATAGYSNKWTTRDSIQQNSLSPDLADLDSNFERVSTSNRIVVNGLIGLGAEIGESKFRWTNLYIRDTLKNTRLGFGQRGGNAADFMVQNTAWYERQLINSQFVAEIKPTDGLKVDVRVSYANSQREAPNEFAIDYIRTNAASDPYGAYFINRLTGNSGDARVAYSNLEENLWSAGVDVSWRAVDGVTLSGGYAYLDTDRTSVRREYAFRAAFTTANQGVGLLRPDLLLSSNVINAFGITLNDNDPNPAFRARLTSDAGYGRFNWQVTPELLIDAGVRYEDAMESVAPIQVYNVPVSLPASNTLNNSYWLPAATVTWQFRPQMQLRFSASKTIARPQFRELIFQQYFDPENNRLYFGNTFLQDTRLTNYEGRFEWYFARDQRLSLAGFYKKIDRPIESYITIFNGNFATSFANAPSATLWGGEVELQKYFDLSGVSDAEFFANRRIVAIANYTYTQSELSVAAGDLTAVSGAGTATQLASDYFRDGATLTGQSDHIANLQLGLEDTSRLSQQTLVLTYASKRVTSRGLANSGQPDVFEHPGLTLDFIMREGARFFNHDFEFKFEARNLTQRRYREEQTNGTNTVVFNRYRLGTSVSFSAQMKF